MGTNSAPLLADLFLHTYEYEFIIKTMKGDITRALQFNKTFPYIDDLRISVYDKREDFNFKIANFPYLDSNIPRNPAYGVYLSQLVRYAAEKMTSYTDTDVCL